MVVGFILLVVVATSGVVQTEDTVHVNVTETQEDTSTELENTVSISSTDSHRIVFTGRLVSMSGSVNGIEKNVSYNGNTIEISVSQVKPDYGPKSGIPQVVTFSTYRVEIVGSVYNYDKIILNGKEYDEDTMEVETERREILERSN